MTEIQDYHPETIWEMLRAGRIQGKKYGNVWFVEGDSVEEFKTWIQKQGINKTNPRRVMVELMQNLVHGLLIAFKSNVWVCIAMPLPGLELKYPAFDPGQRSFSQVLKLDDKRARRAAIGSLPDE